MSHTQYANFGAMVARQIHKHFAVLENVKMIRCDEPMRRAKEEAVAKHPVANQWKCDGDCYRCICGLKKNYNGTWSHVNTQSKLIQEEKQ